MLLLLTLFLVLLVLLVGSPTFSVEVAPIPLIFHSCGGLFQCSRTSSIGISHHH